MKYHKLIKNPKIWGKCVLVLVVLIFCLTLTTLILNEFESLTNSNCTVIKILLSPAATTWNSTQSSQQNVTRFLLINVANNKNNSENRAARHVPNNTMQSQRGYYEEQQPVVVHSESALPVLSTGQDKYARVDDDGSYYSYDSDEDDDYLELENQNNEKNGKPLEYEEYSEGRAAQNQQFDKSQWNYSPWSNYNGKSGESIQRGNEATRPIASTQSPYSSYDDEVMEYDYPMGFLRRKISNSQRVLYNNGMPNQQQEQQQQQKKQEQQQPNPIYQRMPGHQLLQLQQKKPPQQRPPVAAVENSESTLLSVAKGLKTMWEIYQAFSTAWNTIAEHRQRQDNAIKEKLKQQQRTRIRINSRKPPKFGNDTTAVMADDNVLNNQESTTRKTKTRKPKRTTTTTKLPQNLSSSSTKSIVEPRFGNRGGNRAMDEREKRASDGDKDMSLAGEGRYIKGDPLKGYYDFVITEGSYKFWAVFQTGTALLIIYSVFAAIYYSKVNPLVSDYDYTDYLGGSRSLSGGDLDFVDDEDDDRAKPVKSWYTNLLPRAGHSLQFILDAIDKIPVDHEGNGTDEGSVEYTTRSL